MNGVNQSVFVRIPFRVSAKDRKDANLLMLRMKYDDGFAAFSTAFASPGLTARRVRAGTPAPPGSTTLGRRVVVRF